MPIRIAVDAGALATPGDGIARYVDRILGELPAQLDPSQQVTLYGRRHDGLRNPRWPRFRTRADYLPSVAGKPLSLLSSLPAWAAIDRPDVYWGPAHRLPLRLPRTTAGVVTIHDLCWHHAPETMRAATRALDAYWMPRAVRRADVIVCVSRATANDLVALYPDTAGRIAVIHEAGMLTAAHGMPHDPGIAAPYVLFVGTLEPRKNLLRLLSAFARCARSVDMPVSLAIAGRIGWGDASLQQHIDALGLAGRVHLLGHVDDATLSQLYAGAALLALPSLYEGFGLPLVEALNHGTPLLTSNRSSMPEVAGAAAVLVDPTSVDSIADGLVRVLQDDRLRATLAEAARIRATAFSWQRAASETLAALTRAFEQRRG